MINVLSVVEEHTQISVNKINKNTPSFKSQRYFQYYILFTSRLSMLFQKNAVANFNQSPWIKFKVLLIFTINKIKPYEVNVSVVPR